MDEWIDLTACFAVGGSAVAVLLAFVIGYVIGHRHGWTRASSYHNGYRHEDGEIIKRLRDSNLMLSTQNLKLSQILNNIKESLEDEP